ncbi:phage tail tube protein, partial [Sneathiella sp.]|uniref:phage tail tube protein n=1 Tax=Sneathiella sp. TaxID=1964365 RepID=UPI0026163AF8
YGGFDDMLAALMQSSWSSNVLKAGASQPSFTFERAFSDISQYQLLTGCVLDRLRLSVRPDRLITGTFGVIGKSSAMNSSPLDASPTAAAANDPMDSFSGSLDEGGSSIGIVVGLELNIDNNLEQAFVIGADEASSLLAGQSRITGEITTYFEDASLLNKFAARTESSLTLTCSGAGGSLEFELPRIVYTGAENPALGAGPITLSLPFTALYDESESTNLTITRTAA